MNYPNAQKRIDEHLSEAVKVGGKYKVDFKKLTGPPQQAQVVKGMLKKGGGTVLVHSIQGDKAEISGWEMDAILGTAMIPVAALKEARGGKGPRLDSSTRRKANNAIHDLTVKLQPTIPLDAITAVLDGLNLVLLQEDNTEWSGMLLGREGKMTANLAWRDSAYDQRGLVAYEPIINSMLVLTWYKQGPSSWETVAYLS